MRRTLAVVALVLAGCSKPAPDPPPAPPPIDEAAVTTAVNDVWARMTGADTAGNVDAFLAEFHPDVRLDVQGYPAIMGRAAFDSVARPYFAARDVTAMTISPFATSVVSNDLALQGGSFVENFIEKKKRFTEYGRYAASIGRGQDGQWKIMYWMAIIDSTVAAR